MEERRPEMKSMNEGKLSFIAFTDWFHNAESLSADEFKKLFLAVADYVEENETPNFDDNARLEVHFTYMKTAIDRNAKKRDEISASRRSAGIKGNQKRWNNN